MATALSTTNLSDADGGGSSDESTVYHTANDLSVLQTRDAYIDANLTAILHTTPKQHTYLDTTPNTQSTMQPAELVERQRLRIETLEKENAAWVDQYHLATKQNQSLQVYVDQLQQQLDTHTQPATQPTDAHAAQSALAGLLHARNSLYQTLLSENAALLSRLDSLQRRCRVQEGMIDTRNAAIKEMQRICTQQQQQQRQASRRKAQQAEAHNTAADKQPPMHEEEKRTEDEAEPAVPASLNHSLQHSRHSSTTSTASERSVELEQAEALIDAVLMRPPRIFVPTSNSSSTASTTASSPKEERKQLDDSHSSPPRVLPSKVSALSRRIGKPPLTVQSKLQRPVVPSVSTRLSPRSAASPSPSSSSASSASGVAARTRTRSSSATATAGGAAGKVGSRTGGGLHKSPTLSPSLSPVPSSPRSPFSLSSATRPPRPPSSPVPRSPLTESVNSKSTTGKLVRPSSSSSSSSAKSTAPAGSTSPTASSASAARSPASRTCATSALSSSGPIVAQPVASIKPHGTAKAPTLSAQSSK